MSVPQINLISSDTCGQVATFQASFSIPVVSIQNFQWQINSVPYFQNPVTLSFDQPGMIPYDFTLNLVNGCTYTANGTIDIIPSIVLEQMVFPNVITLNGELGNQKWQIDPLYENCASFELQILNRWGHTIFTTNSAQKAFEGKNEQGELLSEGIYFYLFTSGEEKRQGFLHLIH